MIETAAWRVIDVVGPFDIDVDSSDFRDGQMKAGQLILNPDTSILEESGIFRRVSVHMRWPLRYQIMIPMAAAMLAAIIGLSVLNAYLGPIVR